MAKKGTVRQNIPRKIRAPAPSNSLAADPFAEVIRDARASGNVDKFFAAVTVDAARNGDTDAARDVLDRFARAMDHYSERVWEGTNKGPQYYVEARYLADCFERIAAGENAAHALNLVQKGAGRKAGKREYDEDALASMYWFLVRRGFTKSKAKEEISREIGADERTIARAARAFAAYEFPALIEDEILKVGFKPYVRRMSKILARNGHK